VQGRLFFKPRNQWVHAERGKFRVCPLAVRRRPASLAAAGISCCMPVIGSAAGAALWAKP
jgi:hypothetical protein